MDLLNSRLDLPEYLERHKLKGVGVEVGVLFAEYAEHILLHWPGKLHLVDPWVQQPPSQYLDGSNAVDMDAAFRESVSRMTQFGKRANIIRAFSEQAAQIFPSASFDFVYIDANHSYPWIKADLAAWWPKVRSGGLLCGHDFKNENNRFWSCGVQRAVEEFLPANGVVTFKHTPACSSWWIVKP